MTGGTVSLIADGVAKARFVRLDLGIWIIGQTFLLYDYICTFKAEVEYVWSCPWSTGVLLFYLNRYLPITNFALVMYVKSTPMRVKSCGHIAPVILWLVTGGLLASQAIIVLRTYAIWGRRRLIFLILMGWTLAFPGAMVILGAGMTHDILKQVSRLTLTEKTKCATNVPITYVGIFVFYVLMFVGEFVIVILTGIKAKQHIRRATPTWVHELYQNGILQCVCMMSFSLLNSVIMFKGAKEIKMSILPSVTSSLRECNLHSVFCNRVIFLLLKHRRSHMADHPEIDNHQQSGSLYIFTTVHPDPVDTFQLQPEEESSWQARAEREWIR